MNELYYDPYDVEIDRDPYPTYKRLRDEAPIYYNDQLDFWALSRHHDVEVALKDNANLSSAKGDILEVIKADPTMPPGIFINEDPPLHTIHRSLVSRAFTPKKMKALEDQIRGYCRACLDPLMDGDRFDFVLDLGSQMPMRVIGMLVGIPDADTPTVRDIAQRNLRTKPGEPLPVTKDQYFDPSHFAEYVEWRAKNPDDDLITELLNVEFDRCRRHGPQAHDARADRVSRRDRRRRRGDHRPDVRVDGQGPGREPRSTPHGRRGPIARAERRRGAAALRTPRPHGGPLRHPGSRVPRRNRPRRKRAGDDPRRRRTATNAATRNPNASTSAGSSRTSPSGTAPTTASAPPLPAWKDASRSTRS